MTNLDWTIDQGGITGATGAARVAVINDLQAQGHGLDHLATGSLRPVIATDQAPSRHATRLVIGVGTGFNAAPVHETVSGRIVPGSECGHVSLPVRTAADLRLAEFVGKAHGFFAVEDVLSGRGLERLHGWRSAEAGQNTSRTAAEILASIVADNDPLATETGRAFVRLLGAVAGDLALIHLPFGGIYLAGGVARAFAPFLEPFSFAEAFRDKGRFSGFMRDFPVGVIEDDFAALAGCAVYLDGGH
jgi:glucokinase